MSLQCPRCTFIATLKTCRPRQLPRHNRLTLPAIPRRTLTTTLPLSRSFESRRQYERLKKYKQEEAQKVIISIVKKLEGLKPGGTLVISEDDEAHMPGVFEFYRNTDMKIPKFHTKVIRRTTVQFAENNKGSALSDRGVPPMDPGLENGTLDQYEEVLSSVTKRSETGGSTPRGDIASNIKKDLPDSPRNMIFENQGCDFSERRPKPKAPLPMASRASHTEPIVHDNQVSSPTMRQKLEEEWRRREENHKVSFKKGANVDVILERIMENAMWQVDLGEEAAGTGASSGAGYDDAYDLDPEAYASRASELTPGSLVEVRYMDTSIPFLGVFLKSKTGNYSRDSFILTPQGSILVTAVDMSQFTLRGFIPSKQVDDFLESVRSTGRLDPDMVHDMTKLVREFKAKVHLRYPTFNARIDKLHAELVGGDGGEGGMKTVTTNEVARRMIGESYPSREDRYAAHLALLARRDLFSPKEGWEEETTWEIKSLESVERAKKVEKIIRDSIEDKESEGGKIIDGFVEKSRKIIDFGRQARREGRGVDEMDRELGVEWTDEEMEILRAFEGALEYRRGQSATLKSLYPHILGLLDRYDKVRLLDEQRLFEFLGEVGVCSPWEDSVLRGPELGLPGHRASVDSEEDGKLYAAIEDEEGSVEKLGLKDIMEGLRHDWGDMPVYCVDDVETKDIDDGVSLEEIKGSKDVWLHVHVANPTAFLPMDHWISRIAAKKAETFYGPARNYSMIPLRISVEKLGLAPNRPAMTFSMRLNSETGEQIETQVRASTVRNVKRVSYAYMDKLVGSKLADTVVLSNKPKTEKEEEPEPDVDEKDLEVLKKFYKLGWELLQRRTRKGCMEVSRQSYVDVRVDNEHGNMIHPGLLKKPVLDVYEPTITLKYSELTRSKETFSASSAIREAMTAAGEAAAVWSHQRGMMQMYRQHSFTWPDKTEEEKWFELLSKAKGEDGIVPIDFWKLYFPAGGSKLTPHMEKHTALGLDGYIKVTSPLRRFGDFVSHHIIQRQLLAEHKDYKGDKKDLKKPMFTKQEMADFCKAIKHREQTLKSADKAAARLWGIRLLKQLWASEDPRLPKQVDVEIISVAKHPTPASGEIRGLGISGARVYMPGNVGRAVKYGDIVKATLSPWHWSTDSLNTQIVALEYSDFVKTMGQVREEFFHRIGEGTRWEQSESA
ncbi:hypothetical protein TWF718_006904 [Orbilia javanica]|uniref:RNB domain-containing protein n=1 Tax=Orbilia javanica TaxID=47235 RepID=A0AAN8MSG5_9PEZI